jgi:Myb-like DNA-binding domain
MFRHPHITENSNHIPPRYASFQTGAAASKLRTKRKPSFVPTGKENNPSHASVRSSNEILIFPAKSNPFGLNGPWNNCEALAFLEGLESYGPGRWKKIAKLVPTR